jgi:hypothetical protein
MNACCPQSLFAGLANREPVIDRLRLYPKFFCPRSDALGFPHCGYEAVVAFVSGLLLTVSPNNIARLVVSVCVYSFKRMVLAWPWPHIRVKRNEFLPSVADFYASPSVPRKAGVIGVCAPGDHSLPSSPLRRLLHAVLEFHHHASLLARASAGSRVSGSECIASYCSGLSAAAQRLVAHARPEQESSFIFPAKANHPKATKSLSGKILEVVGSTGRVAISHDANLLVGLLVVRADRCYSTCSARLILSQEWGIAA